MTVSYLELVQFYILSHTVMPKSYSNGAVKRSAREERAKQIAKMSKMSAFLKPADSAPPPMKFIKNYLQSTVPE